jgi:TolB protein
MDQAGTPSVLSTGNVIQGSVAWSPDGEWLAFAKGADEFDCDVFAVRVDGTGRKAIARSTQASLAPSWSPDGTRIVYNGHDGERYGVHTVAVDGTDDRYLTPDEWTAHDPAFAADGSYVLFGGIPSNLGAVMVVNADGSRVQILTGPGGSGGNPLPRPPVP